MLYLPLDLLCFNALFLLTLPQLFKFPFRSLSHFHFYSLHFVQHHTHCTINNKKKKHNFFTIIYTYWAGHPHCVLNTNERKAFSFAATSLNIVIYRYFVIEILTLLLYSCFACMCLSVPLCVCVCVCFVSKQPL